MRLYRDYGGDFTVSATRKDAGFAVAPAVDGTPVLDIKPCHLCTRWVRGAGVPAWCSHWQQWYEKNEGLNPGAPFTGRE